jgi:aryl-alcohol dehydrogenase-like predicted oxidoreductase
MESMAGGVVDLGGSGVVVPDMGLGGWQWGDKGRWGFGTGYGPSEIADAFLGALEGRGRFFDTAEVYGHGTSEQVLGWMAARVPEPLVLATKFAPLPGRGGVRAVPEALRGSLRRLRRTVVDLYQVHWADRDEFDIEALMEVLAGCVRDGSVRLLGVSNFTAAEMLTADDALRARGLSLASHQVHYSLLHRAPERDGTLAACRERGATLIAYSPLEQGVLTGRYDPAHRPAGPRAASPLLDPGVWPRVSALLDVMRDVAAAHGGRPLAQVALNWLRAKDNVLPIVGVKNGLQSREAMGARGWSLSAEDLARLDAASEPFVTP